MKTPVLVAAALLGVVAAAPAAEVVLQPIADSHVRASNSTMRVNYGQALTLETTSGMGSLTNTPAETYLKFDLSRVTSVRTAKLRLWGAGRVNEVATTDVYATTTHSWTEDGINFLNKPAARPILWATTALQVTPGWHEWDLSKFLMGEKAMGRDTVTLVLRNKAYTTTAYGSFTSAEGAPEQQPQLVIDEAFPWTYYEAEQGVAGPGAVLQAGTSWGQVAFEARGKQAVVLDNSGEYVEWTNVRSATHATIRYSIPDLASGTLGLYVNGAKVADLALSSVMMRETKTGVIPPDGIVKYYDDVLAAVPGGIPEGATVRVQKDVADGVPVTVDFLEVETAPAPLVKPDATWVEVALNTGNDRTAFNAAITAANAGSKKVWIPAGNFVINNASGDAGINLPAGITIRGAGMWHTRILMNYAGNNKRVFSVVGAGVTASDFKVVGTMTTLANNGQVVVFRMDTHSGTVIERVWSEYLSLTLSFNGQNCIVRDNRVRNGFKDAIHFARDSVNNLIERNCIRNAGDDNVALVSYQNTGMADNLVQYNVGECGWWGRGFTNIGGVGNIIRYNLANNCIRSGVAVMIESFSGQQTQFNLDWVVEENVIVRCGSQVSNPATGSLTIWAAQDFPMSGRMEGNLVLAPPFHVTRLTGFVGDPGTENVVYYRYNLIEAPVAGGTYLRKVTTQLNASNNLVHEPNTDL
jgi:hypothetical protein